MEFWEVYDKHYEEVKRYILTIVKDVWTAEDLVQETFLKVQTGSNGLKDPEKLKPWIFRIAHNQCIDHFRKMKQSAGEESVDRDDIEFGEDSSVEEELEQHRMGQCIQNLTNLLPESRRSVIILFDMMEFSHQEIADILGISVENAKVRLHRARKQLKSILEQKCILTIDERNVLVCEPNGKD